MVSLVFALTLLASLSSVTLGDLQKPIIDPPFKNGLSSLNQGLLNHYPKAPSSQHRLDHTPKWCADIARRRGLGEDKFNILSVRYNDCNDPWIICHHNTSPIPQDKLVEIFGRIPVRMRSYIRHVGAFPGGKAGNHAYNDANNIALFGTTPRSISVMIHETGHSVDMEAYAKSPFDESKAWHTAYKNDKAVTDAYALQSQAENHSQQLVVAMFDKKVPGGIKSANPGWKQIRHQFTLIQHRLGDKIVNGGTCGPRLQNDDDIDKIQGPTFEPRTPGNANYTIDVFDDDGNFRGIGNENF